MGGSPSSAGRLLCVFASLSSALMFDSVVCLGVLVVGLYVCPHFVFVGRRVRGSVGVQVVWFVYGLYSVIYWSVLSCGCRVDCQL